MHVRVSVRIAPQEKQGKGWGANQNETGLVARGVSPSDSQAAPWCGMMEGPEVPRELEDRSEGLGSGTYSSAWSSEIPMAPGPAYTPKAGPRRAM